MSIDTVYQGLVKEVSDGINPKYILKTDAYNEAHVSGLAPKGCHIIDIDKDVVDKATSRGYPSRIGDIRKLEFKDNSLKAILDLSTIDHIEEYILALNEYERVLEFGGKLAIVVWLAPRSETFGTQICFDKEGFIRELKERFKIVYQQKIEHKLAQTEEAELISFIGVR